MNKLAKMRGRGTTWITQSSVMALKPKLTSRSSIAHAKIATSRAVQSLVKLDSSLMRFWIFDCQGKGQCHLTCTL